ncbi:MAG: LysR family transcriptional regulator [Lachnospiraceae bacterium]
MEQNLNYYHIFYEVAKAGNISKAAKNLYISQPAVSKSINKLEESLSHDLFIRSKRGVKLTEEGKILYEHLGRAFSSIETAEKMLNRIDEFGLGQIRIGVSTSLCKHILLPYLQDFISENPHIKVSIACSPTYETIQMLKDDKIDMGLICDTELEKDQKFLPLRSIQDTFVASQTYIDNLNLREQEHLPDIHTNKQETTDTTKIVYPPVAGLLFFNEVPSLEVTEQSLSAKEIIEKSNLMLLDKGNISRQYIDTYMQNHQIEPGQILEVNNMDLLIDFASIGMGVACVVREFISSYIESGQVVEIPLDHEIPKRSVGFVYNSKTMNTTTKRFLDFCK